MKVLPVVLLLVAATAAGALGRVALQWIVPGAVLEQAGREVAPPPAAAPAGLRDAELARLQAEVRMLSTRVADLSRELALVRSAAERQAVVEEQPEAPLQVAAAVPRQQVESILAQLREEEERQQELQRAERERRLIEQRAERIARELGLAPADQARLAGFMNEANTKRQELMGQVRDNGFDREAMRASFQELRRWSNDELTRTFGAPLAEQILDASDDFGPRGGGGWGGRGRRADRQGSGEAGS